MSTIVTRAGKGTALTWTEMDANFTNLNNDKYQSGSNPTFGTVTATTYAQLPVFDGTSDGIVNATTPNTNDFLRADGTWATPPGGGGTPGGADTNVQYNDGGAFGGEAAFAYNKTSNTLSVPNLSMSGDALITGFVSAGGLIGDYISLNQPGSAPVRGWYTPSTTEMRGNIATTNILNMRYDASYSTIAGVGSVPTAWSNTILPVQGFEFGDRGALVQYSGSCELLYNAKVDSAYAVVARTASGTPAQLSVGAGAITMKAAASNPGAGNTITFSTPFTATSTGVAISGTLTKDSLNVGYLEVPQNSKSAAYTTVLADSGKHIYHPASDNNARTFTIDSNANVAYPIGTAITFVNMINTVTIAITSDTMYLAGTGTTGSRTLAAYGTATALKIDTTTWIISGTGLT